MPLFGKKNQKKTKSKPLTEKAQDIDTLGTISAILDNPDICTRVTIKGESIAAKLCNKLKSCTGHGNTEKKKLENNFPCNTESENVTLKSCINAGGIEVMKYDTEKEDWVEVTEDPDNTKLTKQYDIKQNYYYYEDDKQNRYHISEKESTNVGGGRVKAKNTKKRKSKNSTNTKKNKNTSSSSKGKNRLTKYKRTNSRRTKKKGTSKK